MEYMLNELIQRKFPKLRIKTTNISQICAELYSQKILSKEEWELIKNWYTNPTEEAQSEELWKIIEKKIELLDEEKLKKILIESSNHHLIKIIWDQDYTGSQLLYQVRQRNDLFTGRKNLIENFVNQLKIHDILISTFMYILIGLGGIGKSSIVQHLAYEYRNQFSKIFWINSDDNSKLIKQILKIGEELLIFPEEVDRKSEMNLLQIFLKWFENPVNSKWLLVFDNVHEYCDIKDFIPRFGGTVIITSRSQTGWINMNTNHVEKFDPNEAYDYLCKILETKNQKQILELSEALEFLPLALLHAGYYLQNTKETILEYLKMLEYNKKKFLENLIKGSESLSVLASFQISFDKILQENPKAYRWLQICSIYQPDYIPKKFLKEYLEHDSEEISKVQTLILKYYLVRVDHWEITRNEDVEVETFYSMHRLVHDSIKYLLENNQEQDIYYKVLKESANVVQKYQSKNQLTELESSHNNSIMNSIVKFVFDFIESGRPAKLKYQIFIEPCANTLQLLYSATISAIISYLKIYNVFQDKILRKASSAAFISEHYYKRIKKISIRRNRLVSMETTRIENEESEEIGQNTISNFKSLFVMSNSIQIKHQELLLFSPPLHSLVKMINKCRTTSQYSSFIKDPKNLEDIFDSLVQGLEFLSGSDFIVPLKTNLTKCLLAFCKVCGRELSKIQNYASAKKYFEKYLQYCETFEESELEKSGIFEYLSVIHYIMGEIEKSDEYDRLAVEIQMKEFGEGSEFIRGKFKGISEAYFELGDLKRSKYYLHKLRLIEKKFPDHVSNSNIILKSKIPKLNFNFGALAFIVILMCVILKLFL